jgi:hypothetical protein
VSVETIIQSRRTNKFVDRIIMIAASAYAPALGALTFVRGPSRRLAWCSDRSGVEVKAEVAGRPSK